MTTDTHSAAAALAAMRDSRERLAAAATCPPARHLAGAAVLGGLVASQAATPMVTMALEGVLVLAMGLLVAWDRKRTGMFVNGYRNGRTRPLTFLLLAFTLAVLAASIWLKRDQGLTWAPLAGGLVVTVVAYAACAVWQRIYLRELKETP